VISRSRNPQHGDIGAKPEDNGLEPDAARRRYGASEMVANLRAAIAQKRYSHGERLPAERELAARFGTSRGTARHALRELERLELVTRRIGSGTFVNVPGLESASDIAEATSPLELIEVRRAVEPHMVRLAVVNASPMELARVRASLEQGEGAADPATFTEADEEFHLALADCSQNSLIVWLYRQINEVRGHSQWSAVKEKVLTHDKIAEYNGHHRQIYLGIAGRDADAAAEAMNRHLAVARNDLLGSEGDDSRVAGKEGGGL
jgi:GntR family uxuAB operon transcriptional repressor